MNYYNRYPGDYSKDTQDLSLAEHGAFTLLLDHLYGTERVLPKNPVGLFRVCRAFTKEEQDAVLSVIRKFFIETEEGYTNSRFESEQEKARARIDAARENGKKGGRGQSKPIGVNKKNPVGSQQATQDEPSGSALHTPYTIHHTAKHQDQNQGQEKKIETQTVAQPSALREPETAKDETALQAACKQTWESYCIAYKVRYKVDPVRNAKVNAQVKQLCKALPLDEAPQVAEFYVFHNQEFYVRKGHDFGLLVSDATKLRTEWATGQMMTGTRAKQVDRTSSMLDAAEQVKREMGWTA
ncbi:YdaU family protein [uncultured Limnobacter sp.]|uniref:YdaU family protein n=1 Tax=uncultured Limnobacter sp. TaxID=199681 RepID=UPI0030F88E81